MHDFTDVPIFDLNLIAETHGCGWGLRTQYAFREIPLKNHDATLGGNRQHDIERDVVGITIEHPVGEYPEIFSFLATRYLAVSALHILLILRPAYRTRLAGVKFEGLGHVLAIIEFTIQAGMYAGRVITLEIVVDVDLPIALHCVLSA